MLNKEKKCSNCNKLCWSDQFDWCEKSGERDYFPKVCSEHEYKCVGCKYEEGCNQTDECKRGVFWNLKEKG